MLVNKGNKVVRVEGGIVAVAWGSIVRTVASHSPKPQLDLFAFFRVKEIFSCPWGGHTQTFAFTCFGFLIAFRPLSFDMMTPFKW